MHRLASKSTLSRYRLVSLLIVLRWLCIPLAVGLMGWGVIIGEKELFSWGLVGAGVCFLLLILGFMLGGKLKCPLCMMPPMQNRGCAKHTNSATFLGSHPLKVAHSVLLKNHFRCPYCGEPTAMEVRARSGKW